MDERDSPERRLAKAQHAFGSTAASSLDVSKRAQTDAGLGSTVANVLARTNAVNPTSGALAALRAADTIGGLGEHGWFGQHHCERPGRDQRIEPDRRCACGLAGRGHDRGPRRRGWFGQHRCERPGRDQRIEPDQRCACGLACREHDRGPGRRGRFGQHRCEPSGRDQRSEPDQRCACGLARRGHDRGHRRHGRFGQHHCERSGRAWCLSGCVRDFHSLRGKSAQSPKRG